MDPCDGNIQNKILRLSLGNCRRMSMNQSGNNKQNMNTENKNEARSVAAGNDKCWSHN